MSRWQYRFTGSVTRTKASGAFQVTLSETDAAGAMTDTCDSGNLTWISDIRRPGRDGRCSR